MLIGRPLPTLLFFADRSELSSYNDSARMYADRSAYSVSCAQPRQHHSAKINTRMNCGSSRYFGKYDLFNLLIIG